MPDETSDGLERSPKDPVSGRTRPQSGPLERAGTEAERDAQGDRARAKPDDVPAGLRNTAYEGDNLTPLGKEAGRDTERAAAYRENDA